MSRDELIEKFHTLTSRIIPETLRHMLIERCLTLNTLANVRTLLEDLNPITDNR